MVCDELIPRDGSQTKLNTMLMMLLAVNEVIEAIFSRFRIDKSWWREESETKDDG